MTSVWETPMNTTPLPPIEAFLVQAIKTLRRKNTPSTVRPSQLWAVVKSAGYTAQSYKASMRWQLNTNVIFCYGLSDYPREQRIMPVHATNYNFQTDEHGDYRKIRLAILADGLTNEGKRALAHFSQENVKRKTAQILAHFNKE